MRGFDIQVPYGVVDVQENRIVGLEEKPVQRFFGLPLQALDYFDDPVRHDTTQATKDLAALGIECPRLADYLPRLVTFYRAHRDEVRREAMV